MCIIIYDKNTDFEVCQFNKMQKSKYFENKTLFLQIKNIHPLKIKVLIWHMALNKFLVEVTSESQYVK